MSKKKLSKGFDDLFSQNETDLSFLDKYGRTNLEELGGLPESGQNHENADELFEVILRFLKSENIAIKSTKNKVSVGEFLCINKKSSNLEIILKSEKSSLPLVPSDLMVPGFVDSNLSSDRFMCTVIIDSWGISSKVFISRIIEFYKINYL